MEQLGGPKVPHVPPQPGGGANLPQDEGVRFINFGDKTYTITLTYKKQKLDPTQYKEAYDKTAALLQQKVGDLTPISFSRGELKLQDTEGKSVRIRDDDTKREIQDITKIIKDQYKIQKAATKEKSTSVTDLISKKFGEITRKVKGLWNQFVNYFTGSQNVQTVPQRDPIQSRLKEILGNDFPVNSDLLNDITAAGMNEEFVKFLDAAKELRAINLGRVQAGQLPLPGSDPRVFTLASANLLFQPALTPVLQGRGVEKPEEVIKPFFEKIIESTGNINTQALTDPFTLAIKQEKNPYVSRYQGGLERARNLESTSTDDEKKLINLGFLKRNVEAQYMKFEVKPEISEEATTDKQEYGDVQIFTKGEFALSFATPGGDIKRVAIGLDLTDLGDINFDQCDQIFTVLQKALDIDVPPEEVRTWLISEGVKTTDDENQKMKNLKRDDLRNTLGPEKYAKFVDIATDLYTEANMKIAKALLSLGHPELKFNDVETKTVEQLHQESILDLEDLIPQGERVEKEELRIPLSDFSIDEEFEPRRKEQVETNVFNLEVTGPNERQNEVFKNNLLKLISSESLLVAQDIGINFNGEVSNQNSVGTIRKIFDKDGKQYFYFQVTDRPGNIPNISVNGIPLGKRQNTDLQEGQNEIKFDGKTIFKFNLPKNE